MARPAAWAGKPYPGIQRLLLALQICMFSAWAMSPSRKSGWATEITFSALCQVVVPFKLTKPYSVTRYWMLALVAVTTPPGVM